MSLVLEAEQCVKMLCGVLASGGDTPQEPLGVVMVLGPRSLAQGLAAGGVRGGDPGQHREGDRDARVLRILLMLTGGDLRDLEELDCVAMPVSCVPRRALLTAAPGA